MIFVCHVRVLYRNKKTILNLFNRLVVGYEPNVTATLLTETPYNGERRIGPTGKVRDNRDFRAISRFIADVSSLLWKSIEVAYLAYLVWPCLEVNPHDKA